MQLIDQDKTATVLLCGVGGQGTILAADLLAHALMAAGFDVKLSEIHGMAQRGGAVTTIVRYGKTVHSMVADPGTADHIIAFETTEALRNLQYLKQGGTLLVNDEAIMSLPVLTGKAEMPRNPKTQLEQVGAVLIPANEFAEKAGNVKSANVVLIGALAAQLPIDADVWEQSIRVRVPQKTIEVNIAAFRLGYDYAQEKLAR